MPSPPPRWYSQKDFWSSGVCCRCGGLRAHGGNAVRGKVIHLSVLGAPNITPPSGHKFASPAAGKFNFAMPSSYNTRAHAPFDTFMVSGLPPPRLHGFRVQAPRSAGLQQPWVKHHKLIRTPAKKQILTFNLKVTGKISR
ncbi:hypothetical protein TcG_08127 [Trypanosoma cruzi]|nr:hypothetical protein TcG_08127 [Trypanosoma cruzi]